MTTETITWRKPSTPPTGSENVLIQSEHFTAGVGEGWRGDWWYDAKGYPIKAKVTAWAHMPKGPNR